MTTLSSCRATETFADQCGRSNPPTSIAAVTRLHGRGVVGRAASTTGREAGTTFPPTIVASVDAVLHDPPRFGIAGELYSQVFYDHFARVLRRGGRLFHYTGAPNRLTSGRDVPREVARRLEKLGLKTELALDGVLAVRR